MEDVCVTDGCAVCLAGDSHMAGMCTGELLNTQIQQLLMLSHSDIEN